MSYTNSNKRAFAYLLDTATGLSAVVFTACILSWLIVASLAMIVGLAEGWKRENAATRMALLAGPAVCLLSLLGLYAQRQIQGELMERLNVTLSRRILIVIPALVYACLYLPSKKTVGVYAGPVDGFHSSEFT